MGNAANAQRPNTSAHPIITVTGMKQGRHRQFKRKKSALSLIVDVPHYSGFYVDVSYACVTAQLLESLP